MKCAPSRTPCNYDTRKTVVFLRASENFYTNEIKRRVESKFICSCTLPLTSPCVHQGAEAQAHDTGRGLHAECVTHTM